MGLKASYITGSDLAWLACDSPKQHLGSHPLVHL